MRERSLVCTGTSVRAFCTFLIEKTKVVVAYRYCEIVRKTRFTTRKRGVRLERSSRRPGCLAVKSETRCGVPCCISCCPLFSPCRARRPRRVANGCDRPGPRASTSRWGNCGPAQVRRLRARGQILPAPSVRPDLTLWTGCNAGTILVVEPMFPKCFGGHQ
jgi:hypothetical protein